MQLIIPVSITVPEYISSQYHDQIPNPTHCPQCHDSQGLLRHGSYQRWVSWLTELFLVTIARFLCRNCGRTLSCLPDWCLSYRQVNTLTTQRFLDREPNVLGDPEISRWEYLLRLYQRQIDAFAPTLTRFLHTGLGVPPPPPGQPPWPWIRKACGTLQSAARQLVSTFRITLFGRYRCHQPCGFDKPRSAGMTRGD